MFWPLKSGTDRLDEGNDFIKIRGGKREQPNFLDTRMCDSRFDCIEDFLDRSFTNGPGDHPRLAEPAATRAAAHDLDRDAVVRDLDIGDDESGQGFGQFRQDAFQDRHRDGFCPLCDMGDGPIGEIFDLV